MRFAWRLVALTLLVASLALACSSEATSSNGRGTRLAFVVHPSATEGGASISPAPQVAVQDDAGATVSSATSTITVTLVSNGGIATLSGVKAVAAVTGVATFTLQLDAAGPAYRLVASAPGLTADTSAPFPVHVTLSALFSTGRHSCGLTVVGAVFCWGDDSDGQLGYRASTDRFPTPKWGPRGAFARISTGAQHGCGVLVSGQAVCWGADYWGQLGDGTNTSSISPVLVKTPTGASFTTVSAGGASSCALTAAGSAYCWGYNEFGQLGDGTNQSKGLPALVRAPGSVVFSAIWVGGTQTCAIASAGTAYCWGYNLSGQLGNGPDTLTSEPKPVLVQGGLTWATVTTGSGWHTCGLTTGGAAYCWGHNYNGQLGNDTTVNASVPTPVAVPAGVSFVAVAAGGNHSCALTAEGVPYCWGRNDSGQLGDGTNFERHTPVPVTMPPGVSFVAVIPSFSHTCALTASGAAYCWGENSWGQLGNGTFSATPQPVQVVQ